MVLPNLTCSHRPNCFSLAVPAVSLLLTGTGLHNLLCKHFPELSLDGDYDCCYECPGLDLGRSVGKDYKTEGSYHHSLFTAVLGNAGAAVQLGSFH